MSKKFYPVVHCVDPHEKGGIGHALSNVKIARENGADGVFLIGHDMFCSDLCYIYSQVRKQHPDFWIGINFLDVDTNAPVRYADLISLNCSSVDAYWTDHTPLIRPDLKQKAFAGVAFKYMNPKERGKSLEEACEKITWYADVATTSGDKTGSPPTLEKLKMIKDLLPDWIPLAVASGVDAKNVIAMKQYVDYFLVASSIITRDRKRGNNEYVVPEKVRELADLIHL